MVYPKEVKIITVDDHPFELRRKSLPVTMEEINSQEFQTFIDALYNAMQEAPLDPGWIPGGISAVQVNVAAQLFWALNEDTSEYQVFINPEITLIGSGTDIQLEGCLSIPHVTGNVKRNKNIKIKYLDRFGEVHREKYSGWNARVIQHEYDHLLGILFTDKLV